MKTNPKRDFILSQPSDKTADEVVAAAKEAGHKFSAGYVYFTRSDARRDPAKYGLKRVSAKNGKAPPPAEPEPITIEQELSLLMIELGLGKVERILAHTRTAMAKGVVRDAVLAGLAT
jgi:hypothetical protein